MGRDDCASWGALMNDLEFREQYKRLREVHPYKFESKEKMETVWRFVESMDAKWFESLVDRIVMSSKGDLDIGEAVAAERRARKSAQFAEEVCAASKSWENFKTNKGLERVLEKYGANSLFEAIVKSRKGEVG